jgi:hypothetical protein
MREADELRLAMVVLGAVHAEHGLTVTLRREAANRRAADGPPRASCGPVGWRARAICPSSGDRWDEWAGRPYEAAVRLVERLDARGEAVA